MKLLQLSIFLYFLTSIPNHLLASQACTKAKTFAEQQQLADTLYKTIRSCMFSQPQMNDLIKAIQKLLDNGASISGISVPIAGEISTPPIIQIFRKELRVSSPSGAVSLSHHEKFSDLLDLLLKYNADINTDGPLTPLHRTIGSKAPYKTIQLVLDRKANPHKESLGLTPLMYLAYTYDGTLFHHDLTFYEEENAVFAFKKIMTALLKAGADINAQNFCGWTALMCLDHDLYKRTISYMLDANANPYISSYDDEETISATLKTIKLQSWDLFNKPANKLAHKNFFELVAAATALNAARRNVPIVDPFTLPQVKKALEDYHARLKVYEETSCAPAIIASIKEPPMLLDLALIIAQYAGCSMPTIIPEENV
jgi:ankyrin repeat protein